MNKKNQKQKIHYLIYKITNKLNGMTYVGKHQTANILDSYMGSGTYLRRAIAKYGVKNFTKEILFDFQTEEEMLAKEREIVNEEFVKRRDTYNCILGGGGQFTAKNGNHGTNSIFSKLNAMSKIHICNPYTHQKKTLYTVKEIPQEYIDAGWELGTLSKYNTTLISYQDMTLSVRKFSQMHNLKEKLTYKRVQLGWTINELLSIPEDLGTCKTEEEKKAKAKAKVEMIKTIKEANYKINQEAIEEKKKKKIEKKSIIAHQFFEEFQIDGAEKMKKKYGIKKWKNILGLFRQFVAEYRQRKRVSKKLMIEFQGQIKTFSKWISELEINKWWAYNKLKEGLTYQEVLQLGINEKRK